MQGSGNRDQGSEEKPELGLRSDDGSNDQMQRAGDWVQTWRAEMLREAPMIAPARQFVYPMRVAGEEEALARGALHVMVWPETGGSFLATCALGFTAEAMPSGVFVSPNPDEVCLVAGGYAYLANTRRPEACVHLGLRPVVEVRTLKEQRLLLFVGFHSMVAWGANGLAWESARLSWEGVRIEAASGDSLRGFGWNLRTDKEVEFVLDLKTGKHVGGGF